MAAFKHRGEEIEVYEAQQFISVNDQDGADYTVTGNGKVIYNATSSYGSSYATTPQEALDGAKRQIDNALNG